MTDTTALLSAIVLAVLGGDLFLKGVIGTADWLRLPPLLIATTLSAAATSSPELSVSVMAALDGRPGIGLGDALGSNLFNGLAIVGVAAAIHPVTLNRADIGIVLVVGLLTMLLVLPRKNRLGRQRGIWLGLIYVAFVTLTLSQSPSA